MDGKETSEGVPLFPNVQTPEEIKAANELVEKIRDIEEECRVCLAHLLLEIGGYRLRLEACKNNGDRQYWDAWYYDCVLAIPVGEPHGSAWLLKRICDQLGSEFMARMFETQVAGQAWSDRAIDALRARKKAQDKFLSIVAGTRGEE